MKETSVATVLITLLLLGGCGLVNQCIESADGRHKLCRSIIK